MTIEQDPNSPQECFVISTISILFFNQKKPFQHKGYFSSYSSRSGVNRENLKITDWQAGKAAIRCP